MRPPNFSNQTSGQDPFILLPNLLSPVINSIHAVWNFITKTTDRREDGLTEDGSTEPKRLEQQERVQRTVGDVIYPSPGKHQYTASFS